MNTIVRIVLGFYPAVQAIYLFGGYGTADERPDSDVDVALLFPPGQSDSVGALALSPCADELSRVLGRDVDLINLRQANTVFQSEIIHTGRILYSADENAVDLFEMTVMSSYQKLNEERSDILQEVYRSGRILNI